MPTSLESAAREIHSPVLRRLNSKLDTFKFPLHSCYYYIRPYMQSSALRMDALESAAKGMLPDVKTDVNIRSQRVII